jgi:hypothetical protein
MTSSYFSLRKRTYPLSPNKNIVELYLLTLIFILRGEPSVPTPSKGGTSYFAADQVKHIRSSLFSSLACFPQICYTLPKAKQPLSESFAPAKLSCPPSSPVCSTSKKAVSQMSRSLKSPNITNSHPLIVQLSNIKKAVSQMSQVANVLTVPIIPPITSFYGHKSHKSQPFSLTNNRDYPYKWGI